MAHAQKEYFVFWRNGRVHLNRPGASVQSTTGSSGVRISGSNAGCPMFLGSVKSTGNPLHSPVSPSLPLPASPCAITFQLESTTKRRIRKPRPSSSSLPMPLVSTVNVHGTLSQVRIVTEHKSDFFTACHPLILDSVCQGIVMDAEFIPHPGSHKCALQILTPWKMCKFHYEDGPERLDVGCSQLCARSSCLATRRRECPK